MAEESDTSRNFITTLDAGVDIKSMAERLSSAGATVTKTLPILGVIAGRLPDGISLSDIRCIPGVAAAEWEHTVQAMDIADVCKLSMN